MKFIEPEIVLSETSYQDAFKEVEYLNRNRNKKRSIFSTVFLLMAVMCGFIEYKIIKYYVIHNDITPSFNANMLCFFILLLILVFLIIFFVVSLEDNYKVSARIEYSDFLKDKKLLVINLKNNNRFDVLAENEEHEVHEYEICFCNIVKKTDVKNAILNLEKSILYIPF